MSVLGFGNERIYSSYIIAFFFAYSKLTRLLGNDCFTKLYVDDKPHNGCFSTFLFFICITTCEMETRLFIATVESVFLQGVNLGLLPQP